MSFTLVLLVLLRRIRIVGVTFLATLFGAALVLLLLPARYDGIATASIDPSIADPVSGMTTSAPGSIMILQGNLVALAKSNQVALGVVNRLQLDAAPRTQADYQSSSDSGLVGIKQWVANQLIDHVNLSFAAGSNVMTLTYKGSAPEQAASFANAFMSSFIDAAIAMKGSASQKAAAWYAPQMDKIRSDLADAREKLARFQSESKLLTALTADSENDQLIAVTADLTRAKGELVALQTQFNSPAPTAATSNDAQTIDLQTFAALRSNLSNIDADIAKTQLETGANNPKLLEKLALRTSLQKQMQAAIDDYRKKLADRIATQTERVATLQKAYAERLDNMVNIQGQREQLVSLTRQVVFFQEELERLQRAASQARLQSQLSFSNITMIDTATPPMSVAFPKPIIVIPLSILAGLSLGCLFALVAEALDRRLRVADDLQFVTHAPLLGVMTNVHPKQPSRWSRLRAWIRLPRFRRPGPSKTGGALAGS
jgi:polysaccharide biosynthesis transport protein